MLAYVFWHRPRPGVGRDVYEAALQGFHRALGDEALEGFHGSAAYAVDVAPWLGEAPAYEDWYHLEAAFALDTIMAAATGGDRERPHREVAALTGPMAAGLYGLVRGEAGGERWAAWFGKPAGESYEVLYERLEPLTAGGASLWRRQLVLGPTPEFCLLSDRQGLVEGAFEIARERLF